jgi:2-amino-4-hydroxy-6-hydroxymethyldihydropteridine diphosphokinase
MNRAFIITGGNLGDRGVNLQRAKKEIAAKAGAILSQSSIYETAAWGKEDQPSFLNQVLEISTELSAEDLLEVLLYTEKLMGRERIGKMGPRTIDIDILFYNQDVFNLPNLVIPHPHISIRRFVLEPLNEIAPKFVHPALGKTMNELLAECTDILPVSKLEPVV